MFVGANIYTNRTYSPDFGRLTDTLSTIGVNGAILQDDFYDYDRAGNLLERQFASKTGVLSDVIETFIYDDLYRLKSQTINDPALPVATKTYAYGATGNMMTKSDFGDFYKYDPSKIHAVRTVRMGGTAGAIVGSYAYDANGFMTNSNGTIIAPTWFGKANTITGNGITTTFAYDSSHMRMSQSKSGHNTVYLNPRIDQGGHYEKETDTSGANTVVTHKHHIYGGTGVIGVYTKKETTTPTNVTTVVTDTNYFLKDHLGSIQVILNSAGVVKERHRYDAFGNRLTLSEEHHGFTGQEHLDDYGFIDMNARLYDPNLGRFMAADPVVAYANSTQGFNRYSYTDNNPLSRIDLSGNDWWSDRREVAHSNQKEIAAIIVVVLVTWYTSDYTLGVKAGAAVYGAEKGNEAYKDARANGASVNDAYKIGTLVGLSKGLDAYSKMTMLTSFYSAIASGAIEEGVKAFIVAQGEAAIIRGGGQALVSMGAVKQSDWDYVMLALSLYGVLSNNSSVNPEKTESTDGDKPLVLQEMARMERENAGEVTDSLIIIDPRCSGGGCSRAAQGQMLAFNVPGAVAGFVIGGASGFAGSIYYEWTANGITNMDWSNITRGTAIGMTAGTVIGFTMNPTAGMAAAEFAKTLLVNTAASAATGITYGSIDRK